MRGTADGRDRAPGIAAPAGDGVTSGVRVRIPADGDARWRGLHLRCSHHRIEFWIIFSTG